MAKKIYNKTKSVCSNFDLPRIEKQLLEGKKVMLPLDKAFNNRHTHSLDVEYVAEKIFENLKLKYNDEFVKSLSISKIKTMAKWHDVGHCPYGHAGEEQLNSLISENKGFYLDSFYSGYKHNLLSAKILLDLKINVSWDIIDAVIKHSSVLPKNFNLTRANHNNILKLNYIFNCDRNNIVDIYNEKVAVNNSWYFFMKDFVCNFPCQICNVPKYEFIDPNETNSLKIIQICDKLTDEYGKEKNKCKFCVINKDCKNIKHNITQYLLFPFPLTLGGEILRVADEISALVRDIEFYSKYLKDNHFNKYYIIKEKISDIFNILESKFIGQSKNYELIGYVKNLISSKITGDDLINYLISKIKYDNTTFEIIENNKYNNIPLIVRWDNLQEKNFCKSLLEFEDEINKLFDEIKKAIYGIIHNDKFIKDDNKDGEKYISKVFEFYYNNPVKFLSINEHLQEELNLITETIQNMKLDSLVDKIIYARTHIDENIDYMKLLNSFRREIAFFIARLTEKELKTIYDSL